LDHPIVTLVKRLLASQDIDQVQEIGGDLRKAIHEHIEGIRERVPSPATAPAGNSEGVKKPSKKKNGGKR
jgi:hypothetical protein